MAVNSWERELSSVGFLYQTYKMNQYISHVAIATPAKYKGSYDNFVITAGLKAFESLYTANSIMINEHTTDFDFKERKRLLRQGIAEVSVCAGAFHIYMEHWRMVDGVKSETVDKALEAISDFAYNIKGMTLNVIKSDERRQAEFKAKKASNK